MKQILNDPDFQHMSDSDLDDLPLFENADSSDDSDDNETDNVQRIDADSERKRLKREAREQKEKEVNSKADEYMKNALESLRSQSGKVNKDPLPKSTSKVSQRSEVEDQFFNLDEMESFLDNEDAAENRKIARRDKGLPDEDEDKGGFIDLFEDESDVDEGARTAGYDDYFNNQNNENITNNLEETNILQALL